MAEEKPQKRGTFKKVSGALLLGLAAGALYGYLNAPKKGRETRKDLDKTFRQWLSRLTESRGDLEVKLKRIFGVVTKEAVEAYGRIKGEVMAVMGSRGKDIKPGEYEAVVDKLVKKYQKKFKLAKQVGQRLKDELMVMIKEKGRRD